MFTAAFTASGSETGNLIATLRSTSSDGAHPTILAIQQALASVRATVDASTSNKALCLRPSPATLCSDAKLPTNIHIQQFLVALWVLQPCHVLGTCAGACRG